MEFDFNNWESYRNCLTELILKRKTEKDKSVVIFGAGKCDDINLEILINHFELVTLVDFHLDSMKSSLAKYGISEGDTRIKIIGSDFLGIELNTYNQYQELLSVNNNQKNILKFINKLGVQLAHGTPKINIAKHDLGICVGVHSQLLAMINCLFEEYMISNNDPMNETILTEIRKLNDLVAKHFNSQLLKCINNTLLVGFDIMEISDRLNTKIYYNKINELISKNDLYNLLQLANKYSITGAYHGLKNIFQRVTSKEITSDYTNMMIWDFNLDKSYLMILNTINK